MSILLESLTQNNRSNQQNDSAQHSLPDIHSSHFDEDMLGDDSLYRRLKWLQITVVTLSILLLASWIYFYYSAHSGENAPYESTRATQQDNFLNTQQRGANELVKDETKPKITGDININSDSEATVMTVSPTPTLEQADSGEIEKQRYKPEKRDVQIVSSDLKMNSAQTGQPANTVEATSVRGAAVFKEELSEDMQQRFPAIQINSYVVADTAADSFVILDGSFYKVNQVIAPQLVLRGISNENIIVEFHSQLVKVPLK